MSLGLLAPLGLAALAALLLPLLVHLARREEQVPTDFAALRWLAAKFRPRQRLRFEEIVLLTLRMLLVAALALLLAQPVLFGGRGDAAWLVVAPGADLADAPPLPEGAQRRWLVSGFPALDDLPAGSAATGSLLRQLDAELPAGTSLTVLVPQVVHGADGARPQLSRTVDWRVSRDANVEPEPAAMAPFELAVRHAPDREAALPYLRAAAAAWHAGDDAALAASLDIAGIDAPLPADQRPLVWLAPGELPTPLLEWIRSGGTALVDADATWPLPDAGTPIGQTPVAQALARSAALGRGRVLQFAQPLVPASMPELLQPDFPDRLRALLETAPPAPTRADARAYTPLTGGPSFPETPRDLSPWLLWLAAALFALERWLASGRRETAP